MVDKLEQGQEGNAGFDDSDFAWGRAAIGREINRSPAQVTYLLSIGVLDGVVRRVGHKTIVASKRRLREFAAQLTNQP